MRRNVPDMDPATVYRTVSTEEETEALAREIAATLYPGTIVGLVGGLGVGKSVFVRAAAAALGVTETMPSPSYTIVEEYRGEHPEGITFPLLHIDLYRLAGEDEFALLGVDEEFARSVAFIEWIDRAPSTEESAEVIVTLELDTTDPDVRRITVTDRRPGEKR
jgi:tRNA threonylcarbamoyladenosine biosynthesis protein TsaE